MWEGDIGVWHLLSKHLIQSRTRWEETQTQAFFPERKSPCWNCKPPYHHTVCGGQEMLQFESGVPETHRIYGVLIHASCVWCYHEPFYFGSATSQFLFWDTVWYWIFFLCVRQLACSICMCPCVSGLLNVSTAVWVSQAVCLCHLIKASPDHFIAATFFAAFQQHFISGECEWGCSLWWSLCFFLFFLQFWISVRPL